jgi:two-component system CheB/CheR fusion protein
VDPDKRTPGQHALAYAENIIATLREPFVVLDKSLRVRTANAAFYRDFHASKEETEGRFVYELGNGQWDIPALRTLLDEVLTNSHPVEDFEVEHAFPAIGRRTMLLNARRFPPEGDEPDLVLLAIEDITDRRRAEVAMQHSEVRYRRLFQTAKDGILILDTDTGKIIDANPFMLALLGYSHDEFLGKELWEIGLFRDIEQSRAAYRELQEKGYVRYENLPLESRSGQKVEVEFVSNVYAENHHQVVQCNIRDITERRKTERALAKALAYADDIIATLREPFLVLDHELRVKTANCSFYDSFHVTKEETEGRFFYDLGDGQWDIPALRSLLDEVLSRKLSIHDFEVEHSFPTLGRKTMLLNARPFPPDSKHPELILLAVEDVSAERERADELAEASRHKDEFLATLAHELRNPLAPIRNAVQYLGMEGLKEPDVRTARDMIARQVAVMVRLIDDLLDVSRISRNKLDLRKQQVELAAVVESAVESSRPLIQQCGHELTVSLPPQPVHLDADPVRLSQVFSNLLNNAAKYTKLRGHIWLTAEREGSDAVVSVRDNGIGIPGDMLARVFDMFTQVDRSLERSQGGLAIGLTLVRRLVEMHDGSIEARSNGPDQGSEFVVRLPLPVQPPQEPPPQSDGPRAASLSGCRILVVDDNKDSADSMGMLLRIKGNDIRTAHDGLEAVDVAGTFRPELVLLDIGLPKLNGYEVARRIRQQPWGRDAILVALTGWGQDEDRRRSQEAGFNFHIVKPVEIAALEKLLSASQATAP